DRFEEAATAIRDGLTLARRVGNRYWEWSFTANMYALFALGEWDDVLTMRGQLPETDWRLARLAFAGLPVSVVPVHTHRGRVEEAVELMTMLQELGESADVQERGQYISGKARLALAQGQPAEALAAAELAMSETAPLGISSEVVKEALVAGLEASLELGDLAKTNELLGIVDALPPGRSPQSLQAHSARFRA